jgi:hypothetical protein
MSATSELRAKLDAALTERNDIVAKLHDALERKRAALSASEARAKELETERDEARRAMREVARRGSLPIKVDGVWPKGAAEHTCRVIGEAVDWITEPARALSGAGAEDGR